MIEAGSFTASLVPTAGEILAPTLEPVADQDRVVITWRSEIAERGIRTPGCCSG